MGIDWEEILGAEGEDLADAYVDNMPDYDDNYNEYDSSRDWAAVEENYEEDDYEAPYPTYVDLIEFHQNPDYSLGEQERFNILINTEEKNKEDGSTYYESCIHMFDYNYDQKLEIISIKKEYSGDMDKKLVELRTLIDTLMEIQLKTITEKQEIDIRTDSDYLLDVFKNNKISKWYENSSVVIEYVTYSRGFTEDNGEHVLYDTHWVEYLYWAYGKRIRYEKNTATSAEEARVLCEKVFEENKKVYETFLKELEEDARYFFE